MGTTLDGKYVVEAYVARGGFGVVYRGQHLRLRRSVAVKVLRVDPQLDGTGELIREQFEVEARLVAQLEHAAIVRVLDFGVCVIGDTPDVPWMVTEWVDGTTLASDIAARQPNGGRTPAEAIALLGPVFDALVYAHGLGIAHRDIKPANLMFTGFTDGDGRSSMRAAAPRLKLLDFGIAKVMEPDEVASTNETSTKSTMVTYSVRYGAPEQFGGGRTGPWTDIHGMALVLTEMLIGRCPYKGREAMDFHYEAMDARRPTPGRHGVDVGPWEPILARALALRPGERFGSMEEFLLALQAEVPRTSSVVPVGNSVAPGFSSTQGGARSIAPGRSVGLEDTGTVGDTTAPPSTLPSPKGSRSRRWAAISAGVLTVALAATFALWPGSGPPAGASSTSTPRTLPVAPPTRQETTSAALVAQAVPDASAPPVGPSAAAADAALPPPATQVRPRSRRSDAGAHRRRPPPSIPVD